MTTPQSPYVDVLARYATFGKDWHPDGADAIAGVAVAHALAFLDAAGEPRLSVHPTIHGGIQVEIHGPEKDMEIRFTAAGGVEFSFEHEAMEREAEGWSVRPAEALRWWRHYWLGEDEDEG